MSDLQARAAATRTRLAREFAGLPQLEQRLRDMRQANHNARRMGDEPLWSDEDIESVQRDIETKTKKVWEELNRRP